MVKKTVEIPSVEYELKTVKRQALRKVKKTELVTRQKLRKNERMQLPAETATCSCYKQ